MALTPPDPFQCQAEKSTPWRPFALGEPQRMVRCQEEPVAILFETQAEGEAGAMSVCEGCLAEFEQDREQAARVSIWRRDWAHEAAVSRGE